MQSFLILKDSLSTHILKAHDTEYDGRGKVQILLKSASFGY